MFSPAQKKMYLGCFLAYTCAYITRLNFSAALPALGASLQLHSTQFGLIQTLNALLYAAGQMIFGMMADKINPKRFVVTGLSLSALCNVLFGFSKRFEALLLFWCLNGVAQSMLWTPIVTLMATHFEGKARDRVVFGLSISLIAGHLLAWGVSTFLSIRAGWQFSFFIPAGLALAGALAFFLLVKEAKGKNIESAVKGREIESLKLSKKALFLSSGLLPLLLVCILSGFIRDGVINWAPTILSEKFQAGGGMGEWVTLLIIPLFNLAGILIGRSVYRRAGGNARQTITRFFVAGILFTVLLYFAELTSLVVMIAVLLGVCCAVIYGINPLMTSIVPMEYAPFGKVGTVAGLIDSFIYIGSALSGLLASLIQSVHGWQGVFFSWIIGCALALGLSFLSNRLFGLFKKERSI